MSSDKYQEILNFWFEESSSKDHWAKNNEYDQKIRDLFLNDLEKAVRNEYDDWQDEAKSSLALVILLASFVDTSSQAHLYNTDSNNSNSNKSK